MHGIELSDWHRRERSMAFDAEGGGKRCAFVVGFDALEQLDGSAADDFDPNEAMSRFWPEIATAAERRFAGTPDGGEIELAYEEIVSAVPDDGE